MPSTYRSIRDLRSLSGLNQKDFWGSIGVTQSAGSRYENDREMPSQTRELLRLRHELGIDTSLITNETAPAIRAMLAGELDAQRIERRIDVARSLMATLDKVAADAARLAGHA